MGAVVRWGAEMARALCREGRKGEFWDAVRRLGNRDCRIAIFSPKDPARQPSPFSCPPTLRALPPHLSTSSATDTRILSPSLRFLLDRSSLLYLHTCLSRSLSLYNLVLALYRLFPVLLPRLCMSSDSARSSLKFEFMKSPKSTMCGKRGRNRDGMIYHHMNRI